MRCAIYVRVSTNKEEQKASLVNQRELFSRYVSERDWDIYDFYVDIESGTTEKREQLQRLIADAKSKKFDVILAKELSRLARNGALSYQIRDIATQYNIEIITLDNAYNTLEDNRHMFGMYAWMYEEESQRTSTRVKSSLNLRAQRGLFKGSNPPYGYKLTDGRLNIRNDETPGIVKRIFKEYISGKGFDRIARDLYNESIPTPAQIASKKNASEIWQGSSVRVILTNPHYTGDLVQSRTTTKSVTNKTRKHNKPKDQIVVPDTHEAIIPKKDFETVQQLIHSRKKTRPQVEKHLFTNTAFCADCGRGMHYKANCKGYMCGSYNKHGIKACTDHLVREADLKLIILNDIKNLMGLINDTTILRSLDSKLNKQKKLALKNIDALAKEIETLKMRKKKSLSLLVDDMILKEEYDEFIQDINLSINTLLTNQKQSKIVLESEDNELAITEIKQALQSFIDLKELTPEILHRLIDRIEIKADGSPRIFYRFSNPSAYSLLRSINAQHSTCVVCGNISTG